MLFWTVVIGDIGSGIVTTGRGSSRVHTGLCPLQRTARPEDTPLGMRGVVRAAAPLVRKCPASHEGRSAPAKRRRRNMTTTKSAEHRSNTTARKWKVRNENAMVVFARTSPTKTLKVFVFNRKPFGEVVTPFSLL